MSEPAGTRLPLRRDPVPVVASRPAGGVLSPAGTLIGHVAARQGAPKVLLVLIAMTPALAMGRNAH